MWANPFEPSKKCHWHLSRVEPDLSFLAASHCPMQYTRRGVNSRKQSQEISPHWKHGRVVTTKGSRCTQIFPSLQESSWCPFKEPEHSTSSLSQCRCSWMLCMRSFRLFVLRSYTQMVVDFSSSSFSLKDFQAWHTSHWATFTLKGSQPTGSCSRPRESEEGKFLAYRYSLEINHYHPDLEKPLPDSSFWALGRCEPSTKGISKTYQSS